MQKELQQMHGYFLALGYENGKGNRLWSLST